MDQNIGKIPGASNNNELQKIILLGKAHILRRFLPIKNSPGTVGPRISPGSSRVYEAIALKTFMIIIITMNDNNSIIMIIQ